MSWHDQDMLLSQQEDRCRSSKLNVAPNRRKTQPYLLASGERRPTANNQQPTTNDQRLCQATHVSALAKKTKLKMRIGPTMLALSLILGAIPAHTVILPHRLSSSSLSYLHPHPHPHPNPRNLQILSTSRHTSHLTPCASRLTSRALQASARQHEKQ